MAARMSLLALVTVTGRIDACMLLFSAAKGQTTKSIDLMRFAQTAIRRSMTDLLGQAAILRCPDGGRSPATLPPETRVWINQLVNKTLRWVC